MTSYSDLHKKTEIKSRPMPFDFKPKVQKAVYLGNSKQELTLRMRAVMDFIAGKNTSILDL